MTQEKLSKRILEMVEIDQTLRLNTKPGKTTENFLVYAVDGVHNNYINKIIQKYGYPTHEMIGAEAMSAFYILVQHQDYDSDLQEGCLEHCDFKPRDKAHLTDRVLKNKDEPQIYGTQRRRNEKGEFELYPVKDSANLNTLRKEMGLEPLEA